MFNINEKQSIILLSIILFLEFVLVIYTCTEKDIGYARELMQISESNAPTTMEGAVPKDLFDSWTPHEKWNSILNLGKGLRFSYLRILKNNTSQSKTPFSLFVLHTASSLSSGKYSKWPMLISNMLFFFVSLIFLYKMMVFFTSNYLVANLTVLLYATCKAALFYVVFIQPFEIYLAFTIITCYVHLNILAYLLSSSFGKRLPRDILYSLIAVGVCYFFGYFTLPFFVAWIFTLTLVVVAISCIRKNMWFLCNYLIAAIVPVILTWIIYRPSLLFLTGKEGPGFVSNSISSLFSGQTFQSVVQMLSTLNSYIYIKHWIVTLCLGVVIALIYRYVNLSFTKLSLNLSIKPLNPGNGITLSINPRNLSMFVFVVSSALAFYIIISSKNIDMGYICFIIPIFFMLLGCCVRSKPMFIIFSLALLVSLSYNQPSKLERIKFEDDAQTFINDEAKKNIMYDMIFYYPGESGWYPLIFFTRYLSNAKRVYLSSNVEKNIPTESSTDEIIVFFASKLYASGKNDVSDTKLARVSKYLNRPHHRPLARTSFGSSWIFSKK